jgi:protein-tyrosine-phosphatase
MTKHKVLFVGSRNGSRSFMAEAFLNFLSGVSVYGFLDTFLVNQAATFTASFWEARTSAGVL